MKDNFNTLLTRLFESVQLVNVIALNVISALCRHQESTEYEKISYCYSIYLMKMSLL